MSQRDIQVFHRGGDMNGLQTYEVCKQRNTNANLSKYPPDWQLC